MLNKIQELIRINKERLFEYTKKKDQSKTEYEEALYEGIIQEIENSIEDLEELIN